MIPAPLMSYICRHVCVYDCVSVSLCSLFACVAGGDYVGMGVGVGVRVGPRCGAAGCMLRSAPEGGCICARARRIRVLPSSL